MSWLAAVLASFLGAIFSAMGMGGGGILLIYLTAYGGYDQLTAQGINLVFFLPVAAIAIFLHHRKGLVRWKLVAPCVLLGLIGVYFGSKMAMLLGSDILSKLFGGFLLLIGARELLAKPKPGKQGRNGTDSGNSQNS